MRMGVSFSFTVIDGGRGDGCATLKKRERLWREDGGLGWEAGNLDGKAVDLSFRELRNFVIVSVRHESQFLQAAVSLKGECFSSVYKRNRLWHPI